jgi:hypothetical protein
VLTIGKKMLRVVNSILQPKELARSLSGRCQVVVNGRSQVWLAAKNDAEKARKAAGKDYF